MRGPGGGGFSPTDWQQSFARSCPSGIVGLGHTRRRGASSGRGGALLQTLLQVSDIQGGSLPASTNKFKALGATPVVTQRQRSTSPRWTPASNSVRPPSLGTHTQSHSAQGTGLWAHRNFAKCAEWFSICQLTRRGPSAADTLSAAGIHGSADATRNKLCARHYHIGVSASPPGCFSTKRCSWSSTVDDGTILLQRPESN